MILYDPALNMDFHKYGIMLPIAPDRGRQVLEFLGKTYNPHTRGTTLPYPGPVFSITNAVSYLQRALEEQNIRYAENIKLTRVDLERVHSKEFIASLYDHGLEQALFKTYELIDAGGRPHRYEPERAVKPLTDLFDVILDQVEGTWLACRLALADGPGFCYYLGGGMHHARYDAGSGFCLINDVAVAAAKILSDTAHLEKPPHTTKPPVRLIWIIDMDAHKGDGTAELVHFARRRGELRDPRIPAADAIIDEKSPEKNQDNEKPCILTLSIHMAKGWPLDAESLAAAEKDRAPLLPSDIDIGIDLGEEETYTPRLAEGIKELERLSMTLYPSKSEAVKPDLVLVVDGADPYEHDGLLSSSPLNLTLEQCLERDLYVYRYLTDRGIPSAWIQSGGYGDRAWEPPAHFLQNVR